MTAVTPTNSGAREVKQATQGMVLPVLRSMGCPCPIGLEIDLILKLDAFYPGLRKEPHAWQALLDGWADRFTDQWHKV